MNAWQKNIGSLFSDYGETQRSMAKKIGISSGTVSNWISNALGSKTR